MSFADPMWPSRSLRDNPFLRSYFAEQDRQNEPNQDIQQSHPTSSSENRIQAENRSSNLRESNPTYFDREGDFYRDRGSDDDNGNGLFIRVENSQKNDFEAKIIEMAADPFEEVWDVDRIARVLVLANEIQKDEDARVLRKEEREQAKEASLNTKERAWKHASDPLGDFGSLDPDRFMRVEALANAIPRENHLIQPESNKSETFPKHVKTRDDEFFQNESDIRDKILFHQEKIGVVKKEIQNVEKFIEKHIPKADPKQFYKKDSQQYVQFQNKREEQKVQNFENVIRGFNDHFAYAVDTVLNYTPGLKHSSKDFHDQHLMGSKGKTFEDSFYYRIGTTVGFATELAVISGGASAFHLAGSALQKVGQAVTRAGLNAAVCTQLTTGAIGKGVASYLPRAAGGVATAIHHSTPINYVEASLIRLAESAAQIVKNSSEALKKAPEVAHFFQTPIASAGDFVRGVCSFTTNVLSLRSFEKLNKTSETSEIDAVANRAMNQAAQSETEAQAIFEDLETVLGDLDDPASAFRAYGEFAYRQEMRQFVHDMNCPQEAVSHIMKMIPKRTDFATDTLDKTIKNILIAEDNIRYCNKYVKDPWVREKLLQLLMSLQKHHVFSDKSIKSGDTKEFKKILESKYGLDLNKHWNFLLIPHRGRHSPKYHKWCYDNLVAADNIVQSQKGLTLEQQRELLLKIIHENIILPLKENPLLPMYKWYDFWQNDKLQADSMKFSSIKEENTSLQP